MKWIKYSVYQNTINTGAESKPVYEDILLEKKIGYSEENLAIAEEEAYNGEYTIEEDTTPDIKPCSPLVFTTYLTLAGNVNSNMIDAAFGKGNENVITGIGEALAMYAWFKGDSKTSYPFPNLQKMLTISEMNFEVYKEIVENKTLFYFIIDSDYAANKMFSKIQAEGYLKDLDDGVDESEKNVYVNFEVTEEDLTVPFYFTFSASASKANSNKANIYINDVLAQSYWYQEDGSSRSVEGFANWSDYNITTPGTYTIKTHLDVYSDDSDWVSSNFLIYKPKEY